MVICTQTSAETRVAIERRQQTDQKTCFALTGPRTGVPVDGWDLHARCRRWYSSPVDMRSAAPQAAHRDA
eukprot:3888674-Prorocentrum_lima.AAC.1